MVEISLSGSGEGPGWATAPGYSTAVFDVRDSGFSDLDTRLKLPSAMQRFVDRFEEIPVVVLVCALRHRAPAPGSTATRASSGRPVTPPAASRVP